VILKKNPCSRGVRDFDREKAAFHFSGPEGQLPVIWIQLFSSCSGTASIGLRQEPPFRLFRQKISGHRKFLGIGYDLSEEFFHSKEEEIWVSDPSQIGSEEFDFGIE